MGSIGFIGDMGFILGIGSIAKVMAPQAFAGTRKIGCPQMPKPNRRFTDFRISLKRVG